MQSTPTHVELAGRTNDGELRLLTLDEVAGILRVPVSWLRHRVAHHAVACTRLGRHVRFTRAQVEALLESAAQPLVEPPTAGLTRRARRPR